MHVQIALKISMIYTLAEILSIIFIQKQRTTGDLIYDHGLTIL